jgi:hypothetical protein
MYDPGRFRIIGDLDMQVDEQYRKCVCFLLYEAADDSGVRRRYLAGTGFFVALEIPDFPGTTRVYLVTAKHVVQGARSKGPMFARINLLGGGFMDVPCPYKAWHESYETDVAAGIIDGRLQADWVHIPEARFATEDFIAEHDVGGGDSVFFAGLFSSFPGMQRNQPIFRFGRIALMPDEQVSIRRDLDDPDTRVDVDAYLVESRSWGGHSGSPAFVHWPAPVPGALAEQPPPDSHLLGLVQGHYELQEDVAFVGDILGSGKVPMNLGIAIIIPAKDILALLNEEDFVADRKKIRDYMKKQKPAPVPDTKAIPVEGEVFTKEDFEKVLHKATRKVEPPKDEG